ncbi:hypothetical protein C8J57DRAFT_1245211 [Mycena rebaudengoi]|nr:hypothetical protein C8J57DRAFT_1245211 [Mycena rebaudengoi]
MASPQKIRRKPVPAFTAADLELVDADGLGDALSPLPTSKRHSYALYPAPLPVSPSPSQVSNINDNNNNMNGRSPHYRRRATSAAASPPPSPSPPPVTIAAMAPTPASPPSSRTSKLTHGLRLLLPSSPTRKRSALNLNNNINGNNNVPQAQQQLQRLRKSTISTPTPAPFPPALLDAPYTAAYERAKALKAGGNVRGNGNSLPPLRDIFSPLTFEDELGRVMLISPSSTHSAKSSISVSHSGTSNNSSSYNDDFGPVMLISPSSITHSDASNNSNSDAHSPVSASTSHSRHSKSGSTSGSTSGWTTSGSGSNSGYSTPATPLSPVHTHAEIPPEECTPRIPAPEECTPRPPHAPPPRRMSVHRKPVPSLALLPASISQPATDPSPPASPSLAPPPASSNATSAPTKKPKRPKPAPLSPNVPPARAALVRAARLPLVGPDGERVVFGDVLNGGIGDAEVGNQSNADTARRRTLVVFLRHFWCPLCQDYVQALRAALTGAITGIEMATTREEGTGACACAPDPSADISENHGEEEDSVTGAYLDAFSGGSPGGTPEVVPAPASAPAQFASWDRYAHAQSEDSPVLPPPSPFSSRHATAHDDGQEAEDADLARCEDEHDLAQREDEDDLEAEHHAQYLSVSPHASPSGSAASSPSITFAFPWGVSGAPPPTRSQFETRSQFDIPRLSEWAPPAHPSAHTQAQTQFQSETHTQPQLNAEAPAQAHAETQPQSETHLVLVAPGAHTLIAPYLRAFGFPAPARDARGDPGDPFPPPTALRRGGVNADRSSIIGLSTHSPTPGAGAGAQRGEGSIDGGGDAVRALGGFASIRMYVDPRPAEGVYAALGMGWVGGVPAEDGAPLHTGSSGSSTPSDGTSPVAELNTKAGDDSSPSPPSSPALSASTHAYSPVPDPLAAPASYITHSSLSGVGAVLLRALRSGMPVWARGGDIRLLGGEFVFEWAPAMADGEDADAATNLRCTYAHRMQTPRGHAEVGGVLRAAGVVVRESASATLTRKRGDSASSGSVFSTTRSTRSARSAARMAKLASTDRDVNRSTSTGGGRADKKKGSAPPRLETAAHQPWLARSVSASRPWTRAAHAHDEKGMRPLSVPNWTRSLSASSARPWALAEDDAADDSLAECDADDADDEGEQADEYDPFGRFSVGGKDVLEKRVAAAGLFALDDLDALYARGPRRAPSFSVNRYGVFRDDQEEAYADDDSVPDSDSDDDDDSEDYGEAYGAWGGWEEGRGGEDAWMHARERSMARLRERRESRRREGIVA